MSFWSEISTVQNCMITGFELGFRWCTQGSNLKAIIPGLEKKKRSGTRENTFWDDCGRENTTVTLLTLSCAHTARRWSGTMTSERSVPAVTVRAVTIMSRFALSGVIGNHIGRMCHEREMETNRLSDWRTSDRWPSRTQHAHTKVYKCKKNVYRWNVD